MPVSGGTTLKFWKAVLAPAQKLVTLHVALKFHLGIEGKRHVGAELVDLHGMVDHQFGGQQGIDLFCVAAHFRDGVAHRREVRHGRHAGEVLQQHSRGHKRDLRALLGHRLPFRQRLDVLGLHESAVLLAQQVLEQNANRKRKLGHVADSPALERIQAINLIALVTDLQRIARAERIL